MYVENFMLCCSILGPKAFLTPRFTQMTECVQLTGRNHLMFFKLMPVYITWWDKLEWQLKRETAWTVSSGFLDSLKCKFW